MGRLKIRSMGLFWQRLYSYGHLNSPWNWFNTLWFIVYLHLKLSHLCKIWVPGTQIFTNFHSQSRRGRSGWKQIPMSTPKYLLHARFMLQTMWRKNKQKYFFLLCFTCLIVLHKLPGLLPGSFQGLISSPFNSYFSVLWFSLLI